MKMINDLTIDEMMFLIGHYPNLQATEKFYLFAEVMEKYFEEVAIDPFISSKKIKKLSLEKKASFLTFVEKIDLPKVMSEYQTQGIGWVHLFSPEYPIQLKQIYAPPVVLFYKGDIHLLKQLIWLGVVGARDYTPYGKQVVEYLLGDLLDKAKDQIGIVSGLAKGIDTEAHVETLKSKGRTVGVIGTGLNIFYPHNNQSLQQLLAKEHLVLSEYPLGSKPLKFHFPERNRIIAGLSRGILVIESKKRSGSLITAYNALDEDRDVFAVPGSIFELNREGNHRLLQLGAILTKSSEDILKEWFLL